MKKTISHGQLDENMLIKQLIAGEATAFEQIVEMYHSIMLSVARAIIGEAFADEIVQDAWISAIKALPKFEGRSSLKTWLLNITSNGAKSRLRREKRQLSLDDGWETVPADQFDQKGHRYHEVMRWEEATPEALLQNEQLQQVIEKSFRQLPARQRAVLTMYDMEGINMKEMCNILDITASNARVLLHRARTTLHQSIKQYQGY